MKAVRVLLLCVGVLLVLALVALGVALNSSFQTWAARKALASQPDLRGSVGVVSAGFRRVELRDLHFERDGAVLTLPAIEVELPVASAGLSKNVSIHRLVAKGWTLDLTHATKLAATLVPLLERSIAAAPAPARAREFSLLSSAYAAETAPKPEFRGVFNGLLLPVDLSVDGVELDGEIILPPLEGRETARLRVTINGGGLGAGREGSFVVDLAGVKSSGGALTLHGTLTAAMDTPRTFNRFGAKIAAEASGTQLPSGVKLNADVAASRTAAGESYSLLLAGEGKQLAALNADLTTASSQIAGTWKLDLRDSDLTPFAMGRPLPTFAAEGAGNFETTTAVETVHARGHLVASGDRLGRFRAELGSIGGVNLTADFDVLQHGNALRVEKLDAALAGAEPVLSVHALQSFEFDLKTAALQVADPARDLVGLTLSGLPLAWAQPFFGAVAVSGGEVRGEFVMSARDGGLALRATTPLTIANISATRAGLPLLREVDLKLTPSADYTPQGWQAQATELTAQHAGATLLTLSAKAGQLTGADKAMKVAGQWSANLAALMSQPVVASQLQLTSGAAEGDFTGSMDGTKSIEARLALTKLAVPTGEKIPAVSLQLRADVAADGKVTFKAPLLLEQGTRKSDLLIAGTLTPGATGTAASTLDARVTGEQVFVEDAQVLTVLIPGSPAAPSPGPKKDTTPDVVPFWSAVNGQASLALKKVIYGAGFEVTDVNGTLRLEAASLKLDGVRAMFGPESDLKFASVVKFDAAVKERYALDANLTVNNFDTAAAFRALDPTKSPTIESRVTLSSHLTGAGVNLNEAAERARGEVQVTGKSGVFRALSADISDKVQKTQSAVAVIGGLVGGKYADLANKSQIFSDITKALSEIPFDQLNVTATRGADLNLVLKDFTLISPEVRLTGGGEIKHVEGTPLLQQPLTVQLHLGARGKLADLLKKARVLENTQDNLGYASFAVPIKISGTLAKTDASDLGNALLNSGLEKKGLLDNLLGK